MLSALVLEVAAGKDMSGGDIVLPKKTGYTLLLGGIPKGGVMDGDGVIEPATMEAAFVAIGGVPEVVVAVETAIQEWKGGVGVCKRHHHENKSYEEKKFKGSSEDFPIPKLTKVTSR